MFLGFFGLLFSFTVSDPSGTFYQAVVDKKQTGDFDDNLINKTICSFSCSLLLVCRLFLVKFRGSKSNHKFHFTSIKYF